MKVATTPLILSKLNPVAANQGCMYLISKRQMSATISQSHPLTVTSSNQGPYMMMRTVITTAHLPTRLRQQMVSV